MEAKLVVEKLEEKEALPLEQAEPELLGDSAALPLLLPVAAGELVPPSRELAVGGALLLAPAAVGEPVTLGKLLAAELGLAPALPEEKELTAALLLPLAPTPPPELLPLLLPEGPATLTVLLGRPLPEAEEEKQAPRAEALAEKLPFLPALLALLEGLPEVLLSAETAEEPLGLKEATIGEEEENRLLLELGEPAGAEAVAAKKETEEDAENKWAEGEPLEELLAEPVPSRAAAAPTELEGLGEEGGVAALLPLAQS